MAECNGLDKNFLEHHKQQLQTSGVPAHFWPTIFRKLLAQVYDAGEYFQLCQLTYSDGDGERGDPLWRVVVTRPEGIKAADPDHVFIIDHAWSYRASEARQCLREIPGLLERMVGLMDIPTEENTQEQLVESVMQEMWKYNCTYSIASKTAEESLPVWYIMDEFGARIQHCGEPNFRVVPFYFSPHQCCYSLLFPLEDVDEGEEVTRNYVEGPPLDPLTRDALLLPWFAEDLTHEDPRQEEPPRDFFLSGRTNEVMPEGGAEGVEVPSHRPLKVFAEYDYVRNYLTDTRFTVTDSREDADILWLMEHFKDFKSLSERPQCRINQYPLEHLITIKDLLGVVCRRAVHLGACHTEEDAGTPSWLPLTYCLKRELGKFASLYQRREKRGEDNHWIIKPWNLARGLDHTITNNLNHIVRLPATGPKIAQKYISDPVLFHREDIDGKVKFDIRYIVMLLSVKPLKVAVYKRFWLRFANVAFDLTELDNTNKHFTVNNYNDSGLLQMYCHDFVTKFDSQYPEHPWEEAERQIFSMILQVFQAATSEEVPKGIPHNPQCKGFYGLDIMLQWTNRGGTRCMEPQLLEVNYGSDCKRACEYYPDFFNDVLSVMFLDEVEGHNVEVLE
ncbi:hypothetical protein O3P69_017552 [Scylla paramamosain]|uniref:Tubulin--tyrosine ligase-like protein 12 SET-like domain-containing protein n=1 Tax=Scylla paramamosain TaxID=85552 RepID=A0AAW0TZF7_SCYPA